jgi:serine phosphatase RsbU (regulator of sigma subunit)
MKLTEFRIVTTLFAALVVLSAAGGWYLYSALRTVQRGLPVKQIAKRPEQSAVITSLSRVSNALETLREDQMSGHLEEFNFALDIAYAIVESYKRASPEETTLQGLYEEIDWLLSSLDNLAATVPPIDRTLAKFLEVRLDYVISQLRNIDAETTRQALSSLFRQVKQIERLRLGGVLLLSLITLSLAAMSLLLMWQRRTLNALQEANTTMKNDLMAASCVQKSFLPKRPPRVPKLDFSWFFKPCEMLAGDTFNCFVLDSDHIAFYVLDVSGHGVPAALLSVTLSHVLTPDPERDGVLSRGIGPGGNRVHRSPREVVLLLNRLFPMDEEVGQYFTILYGIIHLPTLKLNMVQAGHPYLLVLHGDGQVESYQQAGFPVGMFEDADFEETTISLIPGDRLFFYSDGIVDAVNGSAETYGVDRLGRAAASHQEEDISGITKGILDDVLGFIGGAKIMDDMTMIGLCIT